jgi:hypothetical protein
VERASAEKRDVPVDVFFVFAKRALNEQIAKEVYELLSHFLTQAG